MPIISSVEETIEDKVIIDAASVKSFLDGTRDPNDKVHERIALGLQEVLLLKKYADNHAKKTNENLSCKYVRASFPEPVYVDSEVSITKPQPVKLERYNKDGKPYDFGVALEIHTDGKKAMNGMFLYNTVEDNTRVQSGKHKFVLTQRRAEQVAKGIFKQGADYYGQALGLVSNALYQDGREMIMQQKQDPNHVKHPVYVGQHFYLTKALDNLKAGSSVKITTEAAAIAKTLAEDASRGRFQVDAFATCEGELLYRATLSIVFSELDQLRRA